MSVWEYDKHNKIYKKWKDVNFNKKRTFQDGSGYYDFIHICQQLNFFISLLQIIPWPMILCNFH